MTKALSKFARSNLAPPHVARALRNPAPLRVTSAADRPTGKMSGTGQIHSRRMQCAGRKLHVCASGLKQSLQERQYATETERSYGFIYFSRSSTPFYSASSFVINLGSYSVKNNNIIYQRNGKTSTLVQFYRLNVV